MKKVNYTGGYIALMTTVILGMIMLTLLVVASNIGFSGRFNILDAESKKISVQNAQSCSEIVLLKLKQNPFYKGDELLDIGESVCWVRPILVSSSIFQTRVEFNNSYTSLEATKDGSVWTECAYFDSVGACVLP